MPPRRAVRLLGIALVVLACTGYVSTSTSNNKKATTKLAIGPSPKRWLSENSRLHLANDRGEKRFNSKAWERRSKVANDAKVHFSKRFYRGMNRSALKALKNTGHRHPDDEDDDAAIENHNALLGNVTLADVGDGAMFNMQSIAWLLPLVFASLTWGISEICCDACIDDGEFVAENDHKGLSSQIPVYTLRDLLKDFLPRYNGLISGAMVKRGGKLSGEQGTAVAGLVMVPCGFLLHLKLEKSDVVWAPDDTIFWLAALGGVAQGFAALALYKAYETAPSTLIVPLTQLTAVMTLVVSFVLAYLAPSYPDILGGLENSMISTKDMFAYVLILFAGLYPVAKGNVKMFIKKAFWLQDFVWITLTNDVLLATTYELITICTSEAGGMSPDLYMVITSYSNSVIYFLIFSLIPRFRTEFRRLIDAGVWYIFLAVISELCNWVAAWAITYAYRAHYNSGIVNAVEVSLNQIANLVVAILLKRFFDFGRDEAVTHVGTKVTSCCFVAVGMSIACMN